MGSNSASGTQEIPQFISTSHCHGHQLDDDPVTVVDLIRIALPLPEYVAKRLSEHTGRRIMRTETQHFSRFEDGADLYSVVEYALVTESWCSLLKKADAPAGLLFKYFESIRQGWVDEGGYFYPTPDPEEAEKAITQDAVDEEMATA